MSTPTFPTLPRELRLLILSYTHFLRRYDWSWHGLASGTGATVNSGKLVVPPTSSTPNCTHPLPDNPYHFEDLYQCEACPAGYFIPFPAALFLVSKTMNEDASEVFWGMQRFVIKGDLGAGRRWVEGLREGDVGRIRALDVEVESEVIFGLGSIGGGEGDWGLGCAEQWRELIDAIVRRCCLEKLWLCIDAGSGYVTEALEDLYTDTDSGYNDDHSYVMLKRTYRGLVEPLKEAVKGRGLAKFHVFLCWGVEGEGAAEKEVMGQGYDSEREGKVGYYERDVRSPHWRVLEEEEGRNRRRLSGLENVGWGM